VKRKKSMNHSRFNGMARVIFTCGLLLPLSLLFAMAVLAACDTASSASPPEELFYIIPFVDFTSPYTGQAIRQVEFVEEETSKAVTIAGLAGQSVFLVKMNKSAEIVALEDTGSILPREDTQSALSERSVRLPGLSAGDVHRHGTPPALSQRSFPGVRALRDFTAPAIGDARQFWVFEGDGQGNFGDTQKQITAHLRVVSERCNIWVEDAYFDESSIDSADGKLRLDQIQVLAEKFDDIYRYETAIFGYEQGGGLLETDPKYGGVDGHPKIQILVQDINYDFPSISIGGCIQTADRYTQDELDTADWDNKTNLAEMFYLDALLMDTDPDLAFSFLAHEFQHMIYVNEKQIQKGLDMDYADTWYNEILSLRESTFLRATRGRRYITRIFLPNPCTNIRRWCSP
jgi:hypothetical protein